MKILNRKNIFEIFVLGVLILLSGFSLSSCSKKKKNNNGVNNGVNNGSYNPYNSGYQTAGCAVPGNVSEVKHSSLGGGSTLTIYVVRQSSNSVLLYGDLVMPGSGSYAAIKACLTPSGAAQTYSNSTAFENFSGTATLSGNGMSIQIVPGNTYLDQRSMLGQIYVTSPASVGYSYGSYVSLTGI